MRRLVDSTANIRLPRQRSTLATLLSPLTSHLPSALPQIPNEVVDSIAVTSEVGK
jgi:hypothetical protein